MGIHRLQRSGILLVLLVVVVAGGGMLPAAATPARPTTDNLVYFPQTGHFLGGVFRTFWEQRGAQNIFGFPITEEYYRNADGKLVQYFQRARFELNQVNGQYFVELGFVGQEYLNQQGRSFPRSNPVPNTADQRYFPETGQVIRGGFKAFWEQVGGVELFGYPLSGEIDEVLNGQIVRSQYFQRARFELTADGSVRLGLLGEALAPCQLRPPRPQNLPPSGPLNEGDSSTCAQPEAVPIGRVYPNVSNPGAVLGFEASNFLPGEEVSLWLNLPDGSVRGIEYKAIADGNGYVLIGFASRPDDPRGVWSLVGFGNSSQRQLLAPFRLE